MADEHGRWLKLYTSLQDSEVWDDPQALRVWLWCLQNVNWKDQKTFGKVFRRGSFWCNVRDAAKACRCSTNTWTAAMEKLVELKMVEMDASPKFTTIKVLNWDRFQGNATEPSVSKNETPTETRTETQVETRTETPTETRTETRSRSPRTGSSVEENHTATPSGESSDKPFKQPNAKPAAYDPRTVDLPAAINTPQFREAWIAWCDHRKEIKKPVTPRSVTQQLQWCVRLGQSHAIESIRYTVMKGWQGLVESPQQAPKLVPKEIPSLPGFKPLPTLDEVLRAKIATTAARHGAGTDRGASGGAGGATEGVRATG